MNNRDVDKNRNTEYEKIKIIFMKKKINKIIIIIK